MWTAAGAALRPILSALSCIKCIKYKPSAPTPPSAWETTQEAGQKEADDKVLLLSGCKEQWCQLSAQSRAQLLHTCLMALVELAPDFASKSTAAKGSYGQGTGEEMLAMLPVILGLKEYIMSLRHQGQFKPGKVYRAPGTNQLVVKVFPWDALEVIAPGFRGEVWMAPGQPASQGKLYRDQAAGKINITTGQGGVALVLGAGNQYSVVLLDILHKLIADDQVVLCKMSPMNDYLAPLIHKAFQPLIDAGFLQIICGGVKMGQYLANHPCISSVHITGSQTSFKNMVWGRSPPPPDGVPVCDKPITAELGNVTPYIIIPGPWTAKDIQRQVKIVVSGLVNNASHNCLAAEVLVMPSEWHLRGAFMTQLRSQLGDTYQRAAFYPGSKAKWEAFKEAFKDKQVYELGRLVEPCHGASDESFGPDTWSAVLAQGPKHDTASGSGSDSQGSIGSGTAQPCPYPVPPWLLAPGLTPDTAITDKENWVGVLQEVVLPYSDPGNATCTASDKEAVRQATMRYLEAASEFVNDKCYGSLVATVICHPSTMKLAGDCWTNFIAGLRYGNIVVNAPAAMGFGVTSLPWGAAPGNTPASVESGIGKVHNTFMFDHAVKGVLYAPWKPMPYPFYLPDNWALPHLMHPLLKAVACVDTPGKGMKHAVKLALTATRGGG